MVTEKQRIQNKRESLKKWKKANPEKVKAYAKKHRDNNKEKISIYSKKYYQDHIQERKEYMKKWNVENREIAKKNHDIWKKNNPERMRELKLKLNKKYYMKDSTKMKARCSAKHHIPLKKECGICKSRARLERHHWRYDKPLFVSTLCKDCHTIQHTKNFAGGDLFGRRFI